MAGIIKAAERTESRATGTLKAFHFDDVGQTYLSRVRTEAARLVAEARGQAAKIKAEAMEQGRQAAIDAAQAALRAQLDQQLVSVLAALGEAAGSIAHSRQAWQQYWERHAVELATAIAQRLCRQELSRRPEIAAEWIREALAMAAGNGRLVLRLNPSDHASLATQAEAIASRLTGLGPVQILADPAITPGGCRVETEFGSLDQQLEVQLARLTQELLD